MGYLLILRPLNCMITALSVLVGAWIGLPKTLDLRLLLAVIIGFCACGFGNILNDVFDIEIDSVNAPDRPLVKGSAKKKYAVCESILLASTCLVIAILLDLKIFMLVISALLLLLLYACFLKKYWPANITIAFLTGFSFLLGGMANNNVAALFPFAFSIFIHMPREIIKDLIDETGDRERGIITCAARLGSQKATILVSIYLGIFGLMLPLPFIFRTLNWKYIVVVLAVVFPLLIYLILRVIRNTDTAHLRVSSQFLKLIMIVGLIAMML